MYFEVGIKFDARLLNSFIIIFYATSSVLAPDVSIKAPRRQNLVVITLLNLSWPEQFSVVILAHP